MAKQEGKGWFAILLAEHLTAQVQIPSYILQAIHFAHGPFSHSLIVRILEHRAEDLFNSLPWHAFQKMEFLLEVKRFQQNEISMDQLKAVALLKLPNDAINAFLADIM